tara:strand:- start:640 stop:1200 length:561 start_codon:yes stop_codon:yes gene_type:complete
MNLGDILKTVGSGLIQTLLPGTGSLIVAGINEFLPGDKQLPGNATGEQAQSAIDKLSPELQASVLEKEYDVKIEEIRGFTERFVAMATVDATGNTTRPFIALLMAWVVAFAIVGLVIMLGIAINEKDSDTVRAIGDNWPLVAALLGIPSGLLNSYFGKRTKEKQQKYEATTGVKALPGIIESLFKK